MSRPYQPVARRHLALRAVGLTMAGARAPVAGSGGDLVTAPVVVPATSRSRRKTTSGATTTSPTSTRPSASSTPGRSTSRRRSQGSYRPGPFGLYMYAPPLGVSLLPATALGFDTSMWLWFVRARVGAGRGLRPDAGATAGPAVRLRRGRLQLRRHPGHRPGQRQRAAAAAARDGLALAGSTRWARSHRRSPSRFDLRSGSCSSGSCCDDSGGLSPGPSLPGW